MRKNLSLAQRKISLMFWCFFFSFCFILVTNGKLRARFV